MKPSFDFRDLLPFQFFGVLSVLCFVFAMGSAGLLSFFAFTVGVLLVIAALRSVRTP